MKCNAWLITLCCMSTFLPLYLDGQELPAPSTVSKGNPTASPATTADLNPPNSPVSTTPSPVAQLTKKTATPEIEVHYLNRTSPVAAISGVSGPSRPSSTIFYTSERISREVSANPFLPPDLISGEVPLDLISPNVTGEWDLNGQVTTAVDYDSNIRRTSGDTVGDFYESEGGGAEARWGVATDPVAVDLTYGYSADLFDRQTQFDTFTHNFLAQSRIGRTNLVLQPYVLGRYRSVDDQTARDSGRESSTYLLEGVHGEATFVSGLIYNFDFTHLGVTYPQRIGDNFQEWSTSQELDFVLSRGDKQSAPRWIVYPWLDAIDTDPQDLASVKQIDGGAGTSFQFGDLTLKGEFGWGGVSSNDNQVNFSSYSGSRYSVSADYRAIKNLIVGVSYEKVLAFSPLTNGKVTNQLNAFVTSPFNIDPHFRVIPRIALYRASSDDYTVNQTSLYTDFELAGTYKFSDTWGLYIKAKYTLNIRSISGINDQINDLQTTTGLSLLF